jgi:hypothetical protein
MFTYMEFEDFIPDYYQESIENYMLGRNIWGFNHNISGVENRNFKFPEGVYLSENQQGFGSTIFSNNDKNWKYEEDLAAMLIPMVTKVGQQFPFDLDVVRIRGGMSTRWPQGGINIPHTDWDFPHYTFLYYVNDSDGDTILFNELRDARNSDTYQYDEFTLFKRVTPKRGRAILFNGMYYHSSSQPQNHHSRVILNINFIPSREK